MESNLKLPSSQIKKSFSSTKLIIYSSSPFFLFLIIFHYQASPFTSFSSSPASGVFFQQWKGEAIDSLNAKLRDSVTFLPLKDLRFRDSAMEGNTWFMSSLNDTLDEDGSQYLYFPSRASKSRILCIRGRDTKDGSKNSYALAWPEALPENSTLLRGLTFISDTYYNHDNLWHGVGATAPFVGWSMKNGCSRPERWVLFHWGELRIRMGSWVQRLMEAYYGNVKTEKFDGGDGPYCFEKAVVVRHDLGNMSLERKLKVFELLRCRAREACGVNLKGREREVNERGVPLIRLTLLMRRGSRSFKNTTVVSDIFAKECERVDGCVLKVSQSEDLSFCDQVEVMSNTDIVASPHGAQLTNMIFMNRNSSVMEFFPKGWLEHAGQGQYAHHWLAHLSGMRHRGAWWDPVGDECPDPKKELECFIFHKDGQVGHNETYFAAWARTVLEQARASKLEQASMSADASLQLSSSTCEC